MRTVLCLAVLIVSGCDGSAVSDEMNRDVSVLRSEIGALQTQIDAQNTRLTDAARQINDLKKAGYGTKEWAWLDPAGGPAYQLMQTNIAPVLVSFVDSSAVGDGTRIRFQVGNLSSANFEGMALTIKYNTRMPEDSSKLTAWDNSMRTVEVRLQNRIAPGSWNTVEASLPGLQPAELGHVAMKGRLDVIGLKNL